VGIKEEAQFQLVLTAILNLFAADRHLSKTRGSLFVRKLCVLLNAKSVYIRMAEALSNYEVPDGANEADQLNSRDHALQTLNLILLTASELSDLRSILADDFHKTKIDIVQIVQDPIAGLG
jgi:vacuole morphology and inheritance protein 14